VAVAVVHTFLVVVELVDSSIVQISLLFLELSQLL
jgi:hypothetical protein